MNFWTKIVLLYMTIGAGIGAQHGILHGDDAADRFFAIILGINMWPFLVLADHYGDTE